MKKEKPQIDKGQLDQSIKDKNKALNSNAIITK